jgi:serine/threonine protein kinase
VVEMRLARADMSSSLKDNILVDDGGHAILNDFGLSIEIRDHTGPEGQNTYGGALSWLAPELLFNPNDDEDSEDDWPESRPSPASDVWAFGCTVYEVG